MYEQDDPPVIVGNLCAEVKAESVEKLLEGLGYEFVVRRRLQDAPKATSKDILVGRGKFHLGPYGYGYDH